MLNLLFFTGSYCPACKAMYPTIENIKNSYSDSIFISFIDVTTDPNQAISNNITSIPTILFIKDDIILTRLTGPQVKSRITKLVEQFI